MVCHSYSNPRIDGKLALGSPTVGRDPKWVMSSFPEGSELQAVCTERRGFCFFPSGIVKVSKRCTHHANYELQG